MARVFLSSTYEDLREYRKAAVDAIRRLGHDALQLENLGASDLAPRDWSNKAIAGSDLYVVVVGRRYGYVPPQDNPDRLSLTELEFREAQSLGKPILVFALDPSAPQTPPESTTPDDESRARAFRQQLERDRVVSYVKSPEDLATKIVGGITNWEQDRARRSIEVRVEDLSLAWRLVADFKASHDLLRHIEPSALADAIQKWELENHADSNLPWPQRFERARKGLESRQTDHAPSELWLAWMKATRFAAPPVSSPAVPADVLPPGRSSGVGSA